MNRQEMYEQGLRMMAAAKEQTDVEQARTGIADTAAQQQQEAAPNKEDKQKDPELMLCPCCNKRTLVRPIEAKGELLDHYMACILSGEPFWREYPVYHGNLLVTVSQLTSDEQELTEAGISALTALEELLDSVPKPELDKLQHIKNLIKLYVSVPSIKVKSSTKGVVTFSPKTHVLTACDALTGIVPKFTTDELTVQTALDEVGKVHKLLTNQKLVSAVPQPLLMSVIESHNYLYNILLASGFDTNFWEGIELA